MSGFGCRPFKGIDSSVFPWRVFASTEGSPTSARKKKQPSARGPSGEVRSPPHRLRGARGAAVSQWLPVSVSIQTDWAKRGGLGSPRRFFRPLLGGQKWARRRHTSLGSPLPAGSKSLSSKKQKERPTHRRTSLYPSPVRPAAFPYGRCAGPSSLPRPG